MEKINTRNIVSLKRISIFFFGFWIFTSIIFNPSLVYCDVGYLDVTSDPEGVIIFINGEKVGATPVTGLEVPSGKVNIRAMKKGYGTASQTIELNTDEVKTVRIRMVPTAEETGKVQQEVVIEQDKGTLLIINQLGDLPVSIDGNVKGSGSMKVTGIATGTHKLTVSNYHQKVTIYKDYTLKVKISNEGIEVLNDLEEIKKKRAEKLAKQKAEIERKKKLEAEKERKRKAKQKAELERKRKENELKERKEAEEARKRRIAEQYKSNERTIFIEGKSFMSLISNRGKFDSVIDTKDIYLYDKNGNSFFLKVTGIAKGYWFRKQKDTGPLGLNWQKETDYDYTITYFFQLNGTLIGSVSSRYKSHTIRKAGLIRFSDKERIGERIYKKFSTKTFTAYPVSIYVYPSDKDKGIRASQAYLNIKIANL